MPNLLDPKDGPLLVASHNRGKIWEIRELLGPFGFEVTSADALGLPEPEETGSSFEENARLKALASATAANLVALSDDSGLCVDALGGDPGIYSARWAGPKKDFAMAMRNIEEKLQAKGATQPEDRRGRFVAVLCLAWPDGRTREFRGEVEGGIVWPPRGTLGFGYDPIFLPDGMEKTFGEMMSADKHGWTPGQPTALSHRARAFKLFAEEALGV
ncbi:RdgB/HAM1 family non-canonical purine NTP pyrophosphatase [Mangrovibrevibacter kandeliae]|uniref:RdgB/HAM1 family non-canonical purine NTP pyrophosphatase n=1 Tax=Mangrovibrevibacter kandeliae TaxID=2968473 RepID=UPI002117D539|nr:RdgB/HAM1 family non-canonical purine NTP pyrophosphatase [Aurantimonas sp. CSK15Z-1]MCQ8784291.1 RdgB/HAM1 family non-canonical purine NTP pyrophosphatase [Aurantimonas sp. CSK15Z-1]